MEFGVFSQAKCSFRQEEAPDLVFQIGKKAVLLNS